VTVEVRERTLELTAPLETAAGRIDERRVFLVRVERDGVVGIGEASPLPGWTESVAECRAALSGTLEALEADPANAMSGLADRPAARHGITLAAADRGAREAGRSLARGLGAAPDVDRVPVNATVGDADAAATADAAAAAVDRGFSTVKVKVGARSVAADCERIRAVRAAVGDDVVVRADANAAWSREEAREAFRAFYRHRVSYVEQPLPAGDLAGLRSLRGSGVGVAVDESLVEAGLDAVLEADAADAAVIKPMAVGGPRRAVRLAGRAVVNGVDPVFTTTVDAAVARTAAVHCGAVVPEVLACGLATADRLADDVGPDPAPVEDGAIAVPDGPGIADRDTVDRWWSA
jgi:o-succinylbenzoate synthase